MKKFRRILAWLTVLAMAVGVFGTAGVFAADDEMGNPEFVFGEVKAATASVKGGLEKSNTAVSFDGELFDKGFVAVQGDKGGAWDNDYMNFSLDTSAIFGSDYTAKTNDVLYLSFYYKIPTTYTYNSAEYTSAAAKGVEINAGANKNGGQRMFDLTAVDTGNKRLSSKPITQADGEWHKAQVGFFVGAGISETVTKNIAKDGKTNFSFNFYPDNSSGPFKMLIADEFTVGLMRFDSTKYTDETAGTYTTYIRGLDYLCRTLEATKPDIKTISTDGYITKTENEFEEGIDTGIKKTEYTVTVSSDNPTIKMSNDAGGSFKRAFSAEITKGANGNTVKACAPTYDKTGAESVRYVRIGNLAYTSPALGNNDIKASYADAVNPAEYSETFTLKYDTDYKVFDPTNARHSVNKKEAKNQIVKFEGDTAEKKDITDSAFTQAYVMELIKNENYSGQTLSTGADDNFFQFEYNVGDYGKKGDIMAFSFYIKNESVSKTNPAKRVVVTGDPTTETGTRCVVSDNSWAALEHVSSDDIAPGKGWKRLIYLSNINANSDGTVPTTQWLRISVAADGSQDNKIFVAEPKCTVMKRAEYYYPEVAFRTNNDRLTIAGKNFLSKVADISDITVYEDTVEVAKGQTSVTIKGRETNINKIKVGSKNGDIPYTVISKGNGTYEITPIAIGYNKVSNKGFKQGKRKNKYVYDGTEDDSFKSYDYEKGLTSVVTIGKSDYNNNPNTAGNSEMIGSALTFINEVDENITVTFKKDGAAVSEGNYSSEPSGSNYALTVNSKYFLSVYKLRLAAYSADGELVAASPAKAFRSGSATATIEGLKNDGTLTFKAFIWDGFSPVTEVAEIDANTIGIPIIIR